MASTVGWSFFRYRAFDEPNSEVIARSKPEPMRREEAADDFPNTFQKFHRPVHQYRANVDRRRQQGVDARSRRRSDSLEQANVRKA